MPLGLLLCTTLKLNAWLEALNSLVVWLCLSLTPVIVNPSLKKKVEPKCFQMVSYPFVPLHT